jgi:ribosomal protein S27AE
MLFGGTVEMKKCNLPCGLQHEGLCTIDLKDCKAQTDGDLITEEQFEALMICPICGGSVEYDSHLDRYLCPKCNVRWKLTDLKKGEGGIIR